MFVEDSQKEERVSDLRYEGDVESKPKRSATFGENLVGINFNPSNNSDVDKAKRLCAELADLVYDRRFGGLNESTQLQALLFPSVIASILEAQMNAVKFLFV